MKTHKEIWKFIADNDLHCELRELLQEEESGNLIAKDIFGNELDPIEVKFIGKFNRDCDEGVYHEDLVFEINECLFIMDNYWDSWGSGDYDEEVYSAKLINIPTYKKVKAL